MKNRFKHIGLVVLLFLAFNLVFAQKTKLNFEETLDYINKKVNSYRSSEDKNSEFIWGVSKEGKLKIVKYWNGEEDFYQEVYLKNLDINKIFINQHNAQTEYYHSLDIYTKQDSSFVFKNFKRTVRASNLYVKMMPEERVAEQLKNAITHLIVLAESKPNFQTFEENNK